MSDLIAITSPFSRPLHFLAIELFVLASTALVFAHAYAAYRRGDRRPLFQWLVVTFYGIEMELVAFNFLQNYEHAQFTVQLYDAQLPLYVTGVYGSFMYTGLEVAKRLGVHPIAEAFLAGFVMFLIDVPFDVVGVAIGWWTWLDVDPVLAFRWLGVPVTSYYWWLVFGAVAALLCRGLWSRLERRSFAVAALITPFAGAFVIVFGVIAFLPFHGVAALGVDYGTIVAVHIAGCSILALATRGNPSKLSRPLAAVLVLLPGGCAAVMIWAALSGRLTYPGLQLGAALAALVGLAALGSFLPLRRRESQASPSLSISSTR